MRLDQHQYHCIARTGSLRSSNFWRVCRELIEVQSISVSFGIKWREGHAVAWDSITGPGLQLSRAYKMR
jgi:hypothetical protein